MSPRLLSISEKICFFCEVGYKAEENFPLQTNTEAYSTANITNCKVSTTRGWRAVCKIWNMIYCKSVRKIRRELMCVAHEVETLISDIRICNII